MLALASLEGWDLRLNTACAQFAPEVVAVIAFVPHHFFGAGFRMSALLRHMYGIQCGFRQRDFMWLSAVHMQVQQQSIAIAPCHHCAAFTDFGLAYSVAPFSPERNLHLRRLAPRSTSGRYRVGSARFAQSVSKCRLPTIPSSTASSLK